MLVRHYKGGVYQVIAETKVAEGYVDCTQMIEARHTEAGNKVVAKLSRDNNIYTQGGEFVIYMGLYGGKIWARPRPMFWEHLVYKDEVVSRFVIIEGAKIGE